MEKAETNQIDVTVDSKEERFPYTSYTKSSNIWPDQNTKDKKSSLSGRSDFCHEIGDKKDRHPLQRQFMNEARSHIGGCIIGKPLLPPPALTDRIVQNNDIMVKRKYRKRKALKQPDHTLEQLSSNLQSSYKSVQKRKNPGREVPIYAPTTAHERSKTKTLMSNGVSAGEESKPPSGPKHKRLETGNSIFSQKSASEYCCTITKKHECPFLHKRLTLEENAKDISVSAMNYKLPKHAPGDCSDKGNSTKQEEISLSSRNLNMLTQDQHLFVEATLRLSNSSSTLNDRERLPPKKVIPPKSSIPKFRALPRPPYRLMKK